MKSRTPIRKRPGCLTLWALLAALGPTVAHAQSLEARAGVLLSMPLVEDATGHAVLERLLNVQFNGPVKLALSPTPVLTLAVVAPLRARASLELSGQYGLARLVGSDREGEWDVQDAGLVSALIDVRYHYTSALHLIGGVGATRFFSESTGIFADGSSLLPLLEVGTAAQRRFGVVIVVLDARVQTHTFGTPALRRDGASDGKVLRGTLQLGVRGAVR